MRGCLSLPLRLASLGVLLVLVWIGWQYRDDLRGWVHRVTAEPEGTKPSAPAAELGRSARARLDSLRQNRADSVVLSPGEVRAIFAAEIVDRSHGALDSVSLGFRDGEIAVRARLDADRLGAGAVAQLAEWIGGREPLEARGVVGLRRVGTGELRVTQLRVRGVPLPRAAWASLLESALPGAQDGVVTFPLPPWVAGLRAVPSGLVMYGGGSR